ncbi:uncharacterized protein [Maniola hyperantus]|uniref:uncharacterized protein isoform X1 n=2 Tax=Aphantopus hyperantus TaxID=2795564 RepID=UPI003749AB6E
MAEYYEAVEKHWKICLNCSIPGLGTGIHLEYSSSGSMQPAAIPTEYLLTRLAIIDVSYLATVNPALVLSLEVALQWTVLKHDPHQPTLVLFKFGWKEVNQQRKCVCKIPGLSYELAEYIAANLSHVVGVATDAPTLESEHTREMTSRTVSNVLARNGVYMIENVYLRKRIPDHGCMTIAMPLKMLEASYVPCRLTAFCAAQHSDRHVSIALKRVASSAPATSRRNQVQLEELLD